jgi:hypothetical protein
MIGRKIRFYHGISKQRREVINCLERKCNRAFFECNKNFSVLTTQTMLQLLMLKIMNESKTLEQ